MSSTANESGQEETKLSDFAIAARNEAAKAENTFTSCEIYVRDRKYPNGKTRSPGYEPCDSMFEAMVSD